VVDLGVLDELDVHEGLQQEALDLGLFLDGEVEAFVAVGALGRGEGVEQGRNHGQLLLAVCKTAGCQRESFLQLVAEDGGALGRLISLLLGQLLGRVCEDVRRPEMYFWEAGHCTRGPVGVERDGVGVQEEGRTRALVRVSSAECSADVVG
jgi:hypothetical protein